MIIFSFSLTIVQKVFLIFQRLFAEQRRSYEIASLARHCVPYLRLSHYN